MYMYVRMIMIMVVGVYTSRVILEKLGVDDYGIYNAVASVVAMMGFLNATLSTSTSRFMTFELGRGNSIKLRQTFSTALFTHILLAFIVLLVMETLGLWYLSNKFVIPPGREWAIFCVFHISIFTTLVSICQVPYTASIIAHENMNIYALVGVFEVMAKLLIVYLLTLSPFDRLVFYALLVAAVQIIVTFFFFVYSTRRYKETRAFPKLNKKIFQSMFGFTGWTAVANLSGTMMVQGSTVLMNLFFSPAIIAAKALASQVTHAIMQFVNNFRVALNPQIIKTYAAGDIEGSKKLTLRSVIITFDLLLILGLPFIMTMDTIMELWLVEVPPYAVAFTQVAILTQIFGSITSSTYIGFLSSGRLRSNAVWGGITGIVFFVLLYSIYKFGGGVMWVQYLQLINVFVWIIILRPKCMCDELAYKRKEIFQCYWDCLKVFFVAVLGSIILSFILNGSSLWQRAILFLGSMIISAISAFLFMEKELKNVLITIIVDKIKKIKQ